ncbi:MAG: pimeloyl-ACP methyl ester carboxylesterase [Gammaproteobacteria bacterium]|jgi:pimeloyl-ACP methyl ester carboxylesterase
MPSQHASIDTVKVRFGEHEMTYLAAGPTSGPLVIFVHGWPELGHSWRHQLPVLGGLGFRAIAPDLRGHGGSTVYDRHEDYSMEKHVGDLLALIDSFGRERAVWVGHDWGAPVVWSFASHHPDRCHAIANLCVPYRVLENGLDSALALVDRRVYPEEHYPAGQWEYQLFYQENFARAKAVFEADPTNTITALFRKWSPDDRGKPAITADVRNDNGWLGGVDVFPALERDDDVISAADLEAYVSALTATGFFGSCSFYMNHPINAEYAKSAFNDGYIDMPVLFLTGAYDYVCECVDSRLPEPMRKYCRNLTERTVNSGHWMAQEKPVDVNNALTRWLATAVPDVWPEPPL